MEIDNLDWDFTSLGEVVVHSRESVNPNEGEISRYVAGEHMDTDELRIRRWGEVGDGYLGPAFIRRFHSGQVLYGSRRTYLRKLAVADFEGVCSNTTLVLYSKDSNVMRQDFIPIVMTTEAFHAFSKRESKGSVNPYVNWSDLAKYVFQLPSIEEQKKIAELFWKIEFHTRELQNMKEILKNGLRELLLSEIRDSNFAKSVKVDKLDNFLDVMGGGTPLTKKAEFWNGNIPWVTPVDLTKLAGKHIADSEKKITKLGVDNSSAKLIPIGSVLLSTRGTVGATAINTIPVTTNQSIESLLPGPQLRAEYLLVWIEANMNLIMSRSSGSTFAAITNSRLRTLPVHLPPLEFQDTFLQKWNALEQAISDVDSEIVQSKILLKAIQEELVG
jgi:type I restriction enzyme S subunit